MKVRFAASTHTGLKRAHNEDNYFLLSDQNLYIVADGMGGHASGEVASQIAVETLAGFYVDTAKDSERTWPFKEDKTLHYEENRLVTGIKLANQRVFETARSDPGLRGMGTTLVSFVVTDTGAYLAHVGDSRGYVVNDGQIKLMTDDHSLLNDYLKVHNLSAEEIANFPHKNVIVRALGMKDVVNVDVRQVEPMPGETYLLCSDGLSGMLDDETIARIVAENQDDLERTCQALIAQANANGGTDNITVLLVRFSED